MSGVERDRTDLGLSPEVEAEAPGHKCRRGWLGEDLEGRPVPCLVCRPWLGEAAAAARNVRRGA